MITIERLRPNCQIVLGTWSRFSKQLSAVAMPVYIAKPCMKFTFRGFNEEMPPSLLTSLEREEVTLGLGSFLRTRALGFTR